MGRAPPSDQPGNNSSNSHPVGRKRVKSGCGTCRTRKVKCDEGWPFCKRCVSTGRPCDGYGIWGGGGNQYGDRRVASISDATNVTLRPFTCRTKLATDNEEVLCLEWFECRTAKKIPGLFVLSFWDKLLFQAISTEPAVFHAVVTLSSLHRREVLNGSHRMTTSDLPDVQEQFMLKHYSKAINHLQPHFAIRDRSSIRVALITCVVFICLEFLRGNFRSAKLYLHNGLRMLTEIQVRSREIVDNWIVEALSRLHVQAMLFRQARQYPLALLDLGTEPPISTFDSFGTAWKQLERLFNKLFALSGQVRQQNAWGSAAFDTSRSRQDILSELTQWLDTFETFRTCLSSEKAAGIECLILRTYHRMAGIMAETCLWPDNESIYDNHTTQFLSLLELSIIVWKTRSVDCQAKVPFGHNMVKSHVDVGWIPAWFYTVQKCRVHRIRLQAVRLLESASHREGIWDSNITASVARKVMEIEERDFYSTTYTADDFPLTSSPDSYDLSLPTIPHSYRICDVDVALPNGVTNSVFLYYTQQQQPDGVWRALMAEYNVVSRVWIDRPWCRREELPHRSPSADQTV